MTSDEALVARTLSGDIGAFEALVDRHRTVVLRIAARIVGPVDAEDVSQDAFLRAFNRLDRYDGRGPFRAWLLQIAHNAAVTALARRRRDAPQDPDALDKRRGGDPERMPAERLERRERAARLQGKLELLPPAHRAVLVLRDLEGLSYDEIAYVTDSPIGSVKGRLHRARGELVELLRENAYDWELPHGR